MLASNKDIVYTLRCFMDKHFKIIEPEIKSYGDLMSQMTTEESKTSCKAFLMYLNLLKKYV